MDKRLGDSQNTFLHCGDVLGSGKLRRLFDSSLSEASAACLQSHIIQSHYVGGNSFGSASGQKLR